MQFAGNFLYSIDVPQIYKTFLHDRTTHVSLHYYTKTLDCSCALCTPEFLYLSDLYFCQKKCYPSNCIACMYSDACSKVQSQFSCSTLAHSFNSCQFAFILLHTTTIVRTILKILQLSFQPPRPRHDNGTDLGSAISTFFFLNSTECKVYWRFIKIEIDSDWILKLKLFIPSIHLFPIQQKTSQVLSFSGLGDFRIDSKVQRLDQMHAILFLIVEDNSISMYIRIPQQQCCIFDCCDVEHLHLHRDGSPDYELLLYYH